MEAGTQKIRVIKAISAVVVICALYFGISRFGGAGTVPEGFSNARLQGALISQDIVTLSKDASANLSAINQMDKDQEYAKALTLTNDAITKSKEIREKAKALSEELKTMAQSLESISSDEARSAAVESIQSRMDLIDHLIAYGGKLEDLLVILQRRFEGEPGLGGRVPKALEEINAEVSAINDMNAKATQSMEKFDSIAKGGK